MSRPFPLHAGIATVAAVADVTPSMRRFTLTAPGFADPGLEQPGEILTLGWAAAGEELVLPERGWRFPPGTPAQHWRNFTVRRADPGRATIDVEFFLHGDLGRAARWGLRAGVGDRVGFARPRAHWAAHPAAEWSLLLADETGLPALHAIVESLPAGHRAIAVSEVGTEAERRQPACAADVAWHWTVRGGRPPGTTSSLLRLAGRLELPDRPGQAWGGGEALAMRDLRRHLSRRCRLASANLLGYWRHRTTPEQVA